MDENYLQNFRILNFKSKISNDEILIVECQIAGCKIILNRFNVPWQWSYYSTTRIKNWINKFEIVMRMVDGAIVVKFIWIQNGNGLTRIHIISIFYFNDACNNRWNWMVANTGGRYFKLLYNVATFVMNVIIKICLQNLMMSLTDGCAHYMLLIG